MLGMGLTLGFIAGYMVRAKFDQVIKNAAAKFRKLWNLADKEETKP